MSEAAADEGDQSMLSSNPTVATLNQLIRLNIAAELGFETAAEHVKNRGLKLYLKRYAQQRAQFVDELQQELTRWGGALRIARNPLAALHRGVDRYKGGAGHWPRSGSVGCPARMSARRTSCDRDLPTNAASRVARRH